MMEEIWKDIKGFEGRYQVSNLGRIKSLLRNGLIRKQKEFGNSGYLFVVLFKNRKYIRFSVHRLVAEHFVDGYKKGYIVNHKDEDKHNNRSDNLEWCTYQYNNIYGKNFRNKYDNRKKRVVQKNNSGDIICIYDSVRDAAIRFSTSPTSISEWCRNKHKPKNNYIWSYEDF
jgi:hypothetical protein